MSSHLMLVAFGVWALARPMEASVMDDLASTSQATRDRAAREIRGTYRPVPRKHWEPVVSLIKLDQRLSNVTIAMTVVSPHFRAALRSLSSAERMVHSFNDLKNLVLISLLCLIGFPQARADDPPTIPEPLKQVLPRIRPGMTTHKLLQLLSTKYPRVAAATIPLGGFGESYRLDSRFILTVPQAGSERNPVVGDGHFYLFDDQHWTSFISENDQASGDHREPPDLLGGWIKTIPSGLSQTYPRLFIDAATLPKWIRERLAEVHAGITRRDVGKLLDTDGGFVNSFSGCRFFVSMYTLSGKVVMVDVDYQPEAMPDETYADQKLRFEWLRAHRREAADDVVRFVGNPYLGIWAGD